MNLRVTHRIYKGKFAVGVQLSDGSQYSDLDMVNLLKQGYKVKGLGYSGNRLVGVDGVKLSELPKIRFGVK